MNLHDMTEQAYKNGYAKGYNDAKNACAFHGVTIKPDGVHDLAPHKFKLDQKLRNVTIEILRCEKCGEISIGWYEQENTEKEK